jgi:LacI family transcriptional regulator
MADVARRAGVSKNTVSLALRGSPQIPEATRRRIKRVAQQMRYRRNPVVGELMARLHSGGSRRFQSTLALVNGNTDPTAFTTHPTIPIYVRGCQRRAEELGYRLDVFWLHDQSVSASRLVEIFRTRGIPGGIIVGLMKDNRIPVAFHPLLDSFPFVVTGVRTREPALSFACVDHHMVALRAFEKALELGFERPGLVLDGEIDALVDFRFSAGYHAAQQTIPARRRLRPFFDVTAARLDSRLFRQWLSREKPDVVFTLYNEVRDWIRCAGLRVPQDVALIQYEWRETRPEWQGMNQHNDLTGQAAVDMLVGMLHRGERGPPLFPVATLIAPSWTSGEHANHKLS